ncbi:glutathione peroxidase [Ascidiaceihabitans sp.]|uniref:glutathione peroxidase n=1 Tax=Ascidiaceihabitans sp. TaxID=1872644 RepID=UPI003297BBB0
MLKQGLVASIIALGTTAQADMPAVSFASIDGGMLHFQDWAGQPVLVVNTASQCGFTYQYDGVQGVYDRYKDQGLIVLAVPSDDFNQELKSAADVKEFCDLNFALDLPMADITHVKGSDAHAFYKYVNAQTGFVPNWNFNKVLLDGEGNVVGTWRSSTKPQSAKITDAVEKALSQAAG